MYNLRLWDLRNYKEVFSYNTVFNCSGITFSQRKHLATAAGGQVQIFNDLHLGTTKKPYMKHNCGAIITDLQFCPYEDVLGVGHENGFTSLLIPGMFFKFKIFSNKFFFNFRIWRSEL